MKALVLVALAASPALADRVTTRPDYDVHAGAFLQFDARAFVDEAAGAAGKVDQFAFRSIRPDLKGTLFQHYDFRLMPDFAGGRLVVQDAYIDVHYSDAIELRVGKFKVPFGLERLQAETATAFVERGLPTQLAPNRDLGVELFGSVGTILDWQVGVFNGVADGQSGDGDTTSNKEVAARVFVHPIPAIGLGGAVTYGYKHGTLAAPDDAGYRTQGQTPFVTYVTGAALPMTTIADGRHARATAQATFYRGPIGALAEYAISSQHVALGDAHAVATFDAWQVLAQLVITGEDATFKSVTPKHHYGAFDIAARAGRLRAVDTAPFDAGVVDAKSFARATSFGVGVDWFANKAIRFALDGERTYLAKRDADATETSIIGRAQLAF